MVKGSVMSIEKITSIAFEEILELSEQKPMTQKILQQIEVLYDEILIDEQIKYAWIMEGIMLELDKK